MDSFGILTRSASFLVALILVALSVATLIIIDDNEDFTKLIDEVGINEGDDQLALEALVIFTRSAAGWTIFLSGITLLAALSTTIVAAIKKDATVTMILGIIEMVFITIGMFIFLATGVAWAIYSSAWGAPPRACQFTELGDDRVMCNEAALTATTSILAGLSFVEIGLFVAVIVAIIFSIQSRNIVSNTPPQKI